VSVGVWRDDQIPLADDLFLIALDERSGRSRLNAVALNLGLAGALLGELMLSGHIGLHESRFEVVPAMPPLTDAVLQRMIRHLRDEPQHPVSIWLSFFAQTAADDVAERVVRRGLLKTELRGLLRAKPSYVPTDPASLAWRTFRVAQIIRRRDVQTWADLVLIGLILATGLDDAVLWNGTPEDRANLRLIAASLGEDPTLNAVTTQVSALIAAGVLSQRR
jgi:hypothetical protein